MNTNPSNTDQVLLVNLDNKLQFVRDRTQGVADGYINGFYLWGEGGTSKSYTVEETLKRLNTPYVLTNSRTTGKGLFKLLQEFPDAVHVLEDCETLFRDPNAHGVLRSALWGQAGRDGRRERLVTWQTAAGREEFVFSGGIILIANCPLDNVPTLRALRTRIPCVQFIPTNGEIAAKMRELSGRGHTDGPRSLSPAACLEVTQEIVERSTRLKKNLDLRLLVGALQDRLQWEDGAAECHWRDLLDSRLKERVVPPAEGGGVRGELKEREYEVVRRIADYSPHERLEAWRKETGKSQAALYRRMTELKAQGFSLSHSEPEKREPSAQSVADVVPTLTIWGEERKEVDQLRP